MGAPNHGVARTATSTTNSTSRIVRGVAPQCPNPDYTSDGTGKFASGRFSQAAIDPLFLWLASVTVGFFSERPLIFLTIASTFSGAAFVEFERLGF